MKDPSPAAVGTVKPKRLVIDVRRRRALLQRIAVEQSYFSDVELSEAARDADRAIEQGVRGALRTGGEIIREWQRRERAFVAYLSNRPKPMRYYSSEPKAQPTRTRSNVGCKTTPALPRSRSREQSHAPRRSARSTPKAASRSGGSGDSSDPPGSSPAALAAFLFLLRGGESS